jgi:hypothetical protein
MTRLTTAADYLREIAEIDAMLSAHGRDPSFALRVAQRGLVHRRAELAEQMESMATAGRFAQELDLVLDGDPVERNTIEARFLSEVLNTFQGLVRDLLADMSGRLGRAGTVARAFAERSVLRVAGSFPGSFGLHIEAGVGEFHLEDAGSFAESLSTLLQLVSAGDSNPEFVSEYEPLSQRTKSKYLALLKQLGDNGASMRLVWPTPSGVREAALGARQASDRLVFLTRFEESSRIEHVVGKLDAATHSSATFTIVTDERQRISGTVEEHLLERMGRHWGKRISATLSVREVTPQGGEPRQYYRLSDIRGTRK